jgi:hypothetical protein
MSVCVCVHVGLCAHRMDTSANPSRTYWKRMASAAAAAAEKNLIKKIDDSKIHINV